MDNPILDAALQGLVLLLIIQGLKSIGGFQDTWAKVTTVLVGAVFVAANGLLAIFLTPDQVKALTPIIEIVRSILTLFVAPGIYSTFKAMGGFAVKVFTRSKVPNVA